MLQNDTRFVLTLFYDRKHSENGFTIKKISFEFKKFFKFFRLQLSSTGIFSENFACIYGPDGRFFILNCSLSGFLG